MADQAFDIVMVGAGNKAIITAMYLTKYAGLSVGIFEDRHEATGGWCSEEAMGGGFNNDPCSSMMVHYPMYFGPVWEDFPELRDYGMRFVPHPVGPALVTSDGKALCIHSEEFDPDQEKSAESIARFNKKDAETWLRLWELWKTKWQQPYHDFLFNPIRPQQDDPFFKLFQNPEENGVDPYWLQRSPLQLARELFDSGEMISLICRVADTGGYTMMEAGLGFVNILVSLFWTGGIAACRGGTHNNAHACVRVVTNNGGKIFYRRRVKKILIENGKAKGVLLDDGTEIEAKVAVVTGIDIFQLMFDLVGPEHFDPLDIKRVQIMEADYNSLYWYQCALTEHPVLKAEDFDPDVKWSGYIALMQKPPGKDMMLEYDGYRRLGRRMPKEVIQPVYVDHSLVDTTRAPTGMCSVLFDVFDKSYKFFSDDRDFMKDYWEIVEQYLDIFIEFHKNITRDKIYGMAIEGPRALAGISRSYYHGNWNAADFMLDQFAPARPTPNLAAGRMPVKGLYATGMCFQQGGWAGAWNGYSLYKIMAEDLGLAKPWEDKGRVPETVDVCYKHLDRFRIIPKDVPGYPEPKM